MEHQCRCAHTIKSTFFHSATATSARVFSVSLPPNESERQARLACRHCILPHTFYRCNLHSVSNHFNCVSCKESNSTPCLLTKTPTGVIPGALLTLPSLALTRTRRNVRVLCVSALHSTSTMYCTVRPEWIESSLLPAIFENNHQPEQKPDVAERTKKLIYWWRQTNAACSRSR